MGFRTYDPGLNRFLTRDMYNGALSDLSLIADPFTGNRYTFAGGNPFTNIELDGHGWLSAIGHAALDVAGMIPVVGAVADVANGIWYAAEGDYLDAGLSFAGAIPVIGDAAIGARYAVKGAKYAVEGAQAAKDLVHGAEAADTLVKDAKNAEHALEDAKAAEKARQQAAAAEKARQEAAAAARKAEQEAAQARAEAKAEATAEQKAEQQAATPPCHSFAPETPVLMADGSSKPIKDVAVGDRVAATDPGTGATKSETVLALHRNKDTDMTDVTVVPAATPTATSGADGDRSVSQRGTVLHSTTHHLFYDASRRRFVPAGDLQPGVSTLVSPGGTTLTVTAVRSWTSNGDDMRDLTVDQIHTYYVVAGAAPVLIHNCNDVSVSPMASDWATKGAHVHVCGNEVRVFPTAGGGIGAEPIRLSTGTATQRQVQHVLDCISSCAPLREDLAAKAGAAMTEMNAHNWGNAVNRAAEMNFLIKALAKLG
jgi:hypothetical protein